MSNYKDFDKTTNDVMGKVFPKKVGSSSWGVGFEVEATPSVGVKAHLNTKDGKTSGDVEVNATVSDFGVKFTEKTQTKPGYELEIALLDENSPVDGLSLKGFMKASAGDPTKDKDGKVKEASSQFVGLKVGYSHEYAKVNGGLNIPLNYQIFGFTNEKDIEAANVNLDVDFCAAIPDLPLEVGGKANVAFGDNTDITSAEGGVKYTEGSNSVGVVYSQNDKNEKKVNVNIALKPSDTTYAGKGTYDLDASTFSFAGGMQYPLSDGAKVKVKGTTDNEVGFAYENKISAATKVTAGSLWKFQKNDQGKYDIGSAFSFNLTFYQ